MRARRAIMKATIHLQFLTRSMTTMETCRSKFATPKNILPSTSAALLSTRQVSMIMTGLCALNSPIMMASKFVSNY